MASLKEKVSNVLKPLENKVRALSRSKHSDLNIDLVIEYGEYFRTWKEVTYEDIDKTFIGNLKKLITKFAKNDKVNITNQYDEYDGDVDSFLSGSVEVTADAYDTKDKNLELSVTLSFSGDLYKKVYLQVEKLGLGSHANLILNVGDFTFNPIALVDDVVEEESVEDKFEPGSRERVIEHKDKSKFYSSLKYDIDEDEERFHDNGKRGMLLSSNLKALYDEEGNIIQQLQGTIDTSSIGDKINITGMCDIHKEVYDGHEIIRLTVKDGLPVGLGHFEKVEHSLKYDDNGKSVKYSNGDYVFVDVKRKETTKYLFDDEYFLKLMDFHQCQGENHGKFDNKEFISVEDGVITYRYSYVDYKGRLTKKVEGTFTMNDKCLSSLENICRKVANTQLDLEGQTNCLVDLADDFVGYIIKEHNDDDTSKFVLCETTHNSEGVVEVFSYEGEERQHKISIKNPNGTYIKYYKDGLVKEECVIGDDGIVTFNEYHENGSISECDIRSTMERCYWSSDLVERRRYDTNGVMHYKKKLVGDMVVEESYDNDGNITSKTEKKLSK